MRQGRHPLDGHPREHLPVHARAISRASRPASQESSRGPRSQLATTSCMLPLEISGARLLLRRSQPRSGIFNPDAEGSLMLDLEVGLHVFMTVLVLGTLWRVLQ